MFSEFGALSSRGELISDQLIVYVNGQPRPRWLRIEWKVLNPIGEKCYGPFTKRLKLVDGDQKIVKFTPGIDSTHFRVRQGTYTVIYRLENDLGHRSILRRTVDW